MGVIKEIGFHKRFSLKGSDNLLIDKIFIQQTTQKRNKNGKMSNEKVDNERVFMLMHLCFTMNASIFSDSMKIFIDRHTKAAVTKAFLAGKRQNIYQNLTLQY